jgi:hypothetical protein
MRFAHFCQHSCMPTVPRRSSKHVELSLGTRYLELWQVRKFLQEMRRISQDDLHLLTALFWAQIEIDRP